MHLLEAVRKLLVTRPIRLLIGQETHEQMGITNARKLPEVKFRSLQDGNYNPSILFHNSRPLFEIETFPDERKYSARLLKKI